MIKTKKLKIRLNAEELIFGEGELAIAEYSPSFKSINGLIKISNRDTGNKINKIYSWITNPQNVVPFKLTSAEISDNEGYFKSVSNPVITATSEKYNILSGEAYFFYSYKRN